MTTGKQYLLLLICFFAILLFAFIHLFAGSIQLSFSDFTNGLFNYDAENVNHIIARDFRFPRMMMAIVSGAGLSVAGLLMQNLFNNPLAGPDILGVSTGSSLFVAFSIMTGIPFFMGDVGIIASALIGAMLFGLVVLAFSMVAKSHSSLLLIGIMIGSFSGAFVSVLQSFSDAQELKIFTIWAMGSLQQVSFDQLWLIVLLFLVGIGFSFLLVRSLNAFVLGANQASMLGINVKSVRFLVIGITSLLTGLITAFCGPIAFVGLAVPNLVKIIFKTQNHLILISGSIAVGACFVLICDIFIQLLDAYIHLPINAITSMVGAPFIIFIILKKLK